MSWPQSQFQNHYFAMWGLVFFGLVFVLGAGAASREPCLPITVFLVWWIVCSKLMKRPMRIFCSFCGKCILSDTNWTCGFCSHRNDWRTWHYSFLNKCAKCKIPPTIYACHYCDTPIPLVPNVNLESPIEVLHAAYHLTPPELPGGPAVSRREEREAAIEEAEFEIKLTKLMKERADAIRELRLAEERNQSKSPSTPSKSKREQLEEELARLRDEALAVEEIAARAREAAKETCGDDAELLERHLEVIERWREKHVE